MSNRSHLFKGVLILPSNVSTMNLVSSIQQVVAEYLTSQYGEKIDPGGVLVNSTPPNFTGDFSVVVFPFVKLSKKAPDALANELGEKLVAAISNIQGYNVVKGFLNLELSAGYWQQFLKSVRQNPDYGRQERRGEKVMVEFSSPNTNKPLHLGHIRNILLGWSCSQILDAVGYDVVKVQVINDRGVAICKSMLAWEKYGEGQTPECSGIKGDHLVGDYYVLFEKKSKLEYEQWQESEQGKTICAAHKKAEQTEKEFFKEYKNKWFNTYSELGAQVREMLLKWEANDPATIALWKQMNGWVYSGFDVTFGALGVTFDKLYYESQTYLLGKDIVEEGLAKQIFYKKEDGSVWVDLADIGQDQKVVLRADGTSVYITQDLGTARMRYEDFGARRMVYVVADEQNYHFLVLFEILKRLGEPYAAGLHHLSYGLVELPTGRMKTREGTVVDADDLVAEVTRIAQQQAMEGGEISTFSETEKREIIHHIALGALKFFMIKVNPKKKMIFNPEESVDLQGQTGPYIQYSYVRINSLQQRVIREGIDLTPAGDYADLQPQEKELLVALHQFPSVIDEAAREYDPSHIANYCYALAKSFHRFWHDLSVFGADSAGARAFRLELSAAVGQVMKMGMGLLGIEMPNRM